VLQLEMGCATYEIPATTEDGCGVQTFFLANKAFFFFFFSSFYIFISSKNMLSLESTLCAMSMMVTSTTILFMLMGD